MTPRIYADFNGYFRGNPKDWVDLDTFGTLVDLHYFQLRLTEGLEIMAWDQSDDREDMEVVGTCHYHPALQRPRWCIYFTSGSLVYVPTKAESISRPFICFKCREPFPDSIRKSAQPICSHCGLPIDYPWLAPDPTESPTKTAEQGAAANP